MLCLCIVLVHHEQSRNLILKTFWPRCSTRVHDCLMCHAMQCNPIHSFQFNKPGDDNDDEVNQLFLGTIFIYLDI